MDGLLMNSEDGELGIAVIEETRKVEKVYYLSDTRNLSITFTNGETEDLVSEIDPLFENSLFGCKKIHIGHFHQNGLDKDPTHEYQVPLGF